MSDLRQRWDAFDADDDVDLDDGADGHELDGDDLGVPNRRRGGAARFGIIAVVLLGVWLAVSMRQQSDDEIVAVTPSPRGVVDVPAGFAASEVLAPDLSMESDSTGTWTLLAADDARMTNGTWVVAACRAAGSGEVRNAGGIVTASLGADLVVDSSDDDGGVRVAAARSGGLRTAIVLDRRPTWIVTVIAANWDGDTTDLARTIYDAATVDGCADAPALAARTADLPVRQERSLGMPVLPIGLRVVSADETTVAWVGDGPSETIVLTSQRPGTGADDGDLIEFMRPPGDSEAEVLIGSTLAYRADDLDGSEALIWHRDGVIHTLSLGAAVDADVVALAGTLRTPDEATWQLLVESAA